MCGHQEMQGKIYIRLGNLGKVLQLLLPKILIGGKLMLVEFRGCTACHAVGTQSVLAIVVACHHHHSPEGHFG